jgi:hypothetical protein
MAAVVAVAFAVQGQAAWTSEIQSSRSLRPADARVQPDWVDRHATGSVALVSWGFVSPLTYADTIYFNKAIDHHYFAPPRPATLVPGLCDVAILADGTLRFDRACGPAPHRLLLADGVARLRFAGEQRSVTHDQATRLVDLDPRHPPRLLSFVTLPCMQPAPTNGVLRPNTAPCLRQMGVSLWLGRPGVLRLTFQGGAVDQHIEVGGRPQRLAARVPTTLRLPVGRGASQLAMPIDWDTPTGTPTVTALTLTSGGRTTSLLY